jgi:phage internal scaffolding protein
MTDTIETRPRVQVTPVGVSKTEKSHRSRCNINTIVARSIRSGFMQEQRLSEQNYGDFTQAVDYHSCVQAVRNAERAFMSLPSKIRSRFKNDPGELINYLENVDNHKEAIELGIIQASPAVDESPVEEPVTEPAEPEPE